MNYNKLFGMADQDDEELKPTLIKLFGSQFPKRQQRKRWEIAMAINAFADYHMLDGSKTFLGVGAGTERTIFYLTGFAKSVHATDLYYNSGNWVRAAPANMLTDPDRFAPTEFRYDRRRLVVQHMDMLDLRYEDNSFDGVFSSGSIEHVGTMEQIQHAAAEIGRVLKPGGMACISTEYKLSGPEKGDGFPGVTLFDSASLLWNIIRPSGLQLVDKLDLHIDQDTLSTVYPLDEFSRAWDEHRTIDVDDTVLSHVGYTWTSVHLAMVKPAKSAYDANKVVI